MIGGLELIEYKAQVLLEFSKEQISIPSGLNLCCKRFFYKRRVLTLDILL